MGFQAIAKLWIGFISTGSAHDFTVSYTLLIKVLIRDDLFLVAVFKAEDNSNVFLQMCVKVFFFFSFFF